MSGLGSSNRSRNSFRIAHFSNHHDISILAKDSCKSSMEVRGVDFDFALLDQRLLRFVDIFDRIFNSNDVLQPLAIDSLDHRGKGGRLAYPNRTNHQKKALLALRKSFNYWRQV